VTESCEFCGRSVRPGEKLVAEYVSGWVFPRDAGGANALALKEEHGRYACWSCIDRQRKGLSPYQGSLL
jgi:hypothetical protein